MRRVGRHSGFAEVRRAVRALLSRLTLPVDSLVLAAVSGGGDSLALAAALAAEAPPAGLRGGAVTVDHRLQPGSGERAETVAETCRRLGLCPVAVEAASVEPDSGQGPEAAAREARYAALDAAAERLGAAVVLLGHTLDDQAETVLLGLARGSGGRSLAGMPEVRGRFARPLLGLRRATTVVACRDLGLQPWQDPHNAERRYSRARVRHDVLPALESALGPGIAEALSRTAGLLREDADALDTVADGVRAAAATPDGGLDVAALAQWPAAVRRRVIRAAAALAGVPAAGLTAAHLRAADALVGDWRGQGPVRLPGGYDILRSRGRSCDRLVFDDRSVAADDGSDHRRSRRSGEG